MASPFDPITINGLTLANRFVRSATWEGLADEDGASTPRLDAMMAELARGEVGLIISGYAFVAPEGRSSSRQLAAYDDRFVPGLRAMARAVHDAGGKIALQIVHGGAFALGEERLGPSAGGEGGVPACTPLTAAGIARLVGAFREAALRAQRAGFDAVQLHAAHGFLPSAFLCPAINKRTDEYGGALANRARFLLEIARAVRAACGPGFPLLVKLNSEDFVEGGLTREEAVEVSRMLEEAGADAIEYSGGMGLSEAKLQPPRPGARRKEDEVYYREAARLYKRAVAIPLLLVGGFRSLEVAEEVVAAGLADCVSLSRPLIREPGLVRRWREGDRRKSACGSCNECFGAAADGGGVRCMVAERARARR